jgi:hypothetical protein
MQTAGSLPCQLNAIVRPKRASRRNGRAVALLGQRHMWTSHIYLFSLESADTWPTSVKQAHVLQPPLINRMQEFSPASSLAWSHIRTSRTAQQCRDLLEVSALSLNLCGVQEDYQGEQRVRSLHGTYI